MARKSATRAADKTEMVKWLFENSRDLMHVAADGVFRLVNPAWCELTGLTEDQLVGRPLMDFYHPEDHAGIRHRRSNVASGGAC